MNLVIYFSLFGNTKKIAEVIIKNFDAEELRIDDNLPKLIKIIVHFIKGSKHRKIVDVPRIDLAKYDTIFVGGPVWAGKPCPALLDIIDQLKLNGKKVIGFLSHRGRLGAALEELKHSIAANKGIVVKLVGIKSGENEDAIVAKFEGAKNPNNSQ